MGWFLPALGKAAIGLVTGGIVRRQQKKDQAREAAAAAAHHKAQEKARQKQEQKQRQQIRAENREDSVIDFARLRNEAQKNGFNPLTALAMGGAVAPGSLGAPGFTNTDAPYTPPLSSAGFLADTLDRAVNTMFSAKSEYDRAAEEAKDRQEAKARWEAEMAVKYNRGFGRELTRQQVFYPEGSRGAPVLARPSDKYDYRQDVEAMDRPGVHPLRRDPEYIPVRMPNGDFGQLEKSVASRLDISAFDTLSGGDMEEIAGEAVGNVYTGANAPAVWRTQTNEHPISRRRVTGPASRGTLAEGLREKDPAYQKPAPKRRVRGGGRP